MPATTVATVPGRTGREPAGELAAVLLALGRHRDPAEAFQLLYGLVIQDLQIRVPLGEAPPPPTALTANSAN